MNRRRGKGGFGDPRLPVAKRYQRPGSRRTMVAIGGVAALLTLVVVGADFALGRARLLSNGPLSSSHASLERDCASCHVRFATVSAENCSLCHERYGDRLGVYTWAAHYLYRSGDFGRVVPSPHEVACASCHREHDGRQASIVPAGDQQCRRCHDFGSFDAGHPDFDHADGGGESAGLRFPHLHHLREVMAREQLVDVERACLYCHNPEPDGRGFAALDFDRHCDACHLTTTTATPPLPVTRGDELGVVTLATLQASSDPGNRWSFFVNPNELRERGGSVRKTPVYHRDPWLLANLRRLRQRLYPDAGVADLLVAGGDAAPEQLPELYREAVATLRAYAVELRARPEREVQRELRQIERQLAELERRLRDPYTPLDETAFLLALDRAEGAPEAAAVTALVDELTAPCQECHLVADATIARVQKEQRALRRAEFDHRAHIIQRRCGDCHTAIPFDEIPASGETVDRGLDHADIENLPTIATCRQCHRPRLAASSCVTCHRFHPNQDQRSDLLLYLD